MSKSLSVLITIIIMIVLAGIGYYFLNQNFQNQKDDLQSQITDLQNQAQTSESVSSVDTSDWKTYTNDTLGFSIKYPKEYFIKNNNNIIDGIKDDSNILISDLKNMSKDVLSSEKIHITINADKGTLSDSLNELRGGPNEAESVKINSLNAKKYLEGPSPDATGFANILWVNYLLEKNGLVYLLQATNSEDVNVVQPTENDANFIIMSSIINTFQFTK